jgi:hypothetical protein
LLVEYAEWNTRTSADPYAVIAATRWCDRELTTLEKAEGPVPAPILID